MLTGPRRSLSVSSTSVAASPFNRPATLPELLQSDRTPFMVFMPELSMVDHPLVCRSHTVLPVLTLRLFLLHHQGRLCALKFVRVFGREMFENVPHIYAIADKSHRAMRQKASRLPEYKILELTGDPKSYFYTSQGSKAQTTDTDRTNHRATIAACKTLGFTAAEIDTLWRVVAAVLHLGNVKFQIDPGSDDIKVSGDSVNKVCKLLQVTEADFRRALTERVIAARGEVMMKMHTAVEAENGRDALAKTTKRPLTAGTLFKNSMIALVKTLASKEPFYVRCIKPNEHKTPTGINDELVEHQVRYLGLLENVRVRRAGFAHRHRYDLFLRRYKMISRYTWPNYRGSDKEGTKVLIDEKGFSHDVKYGETKIFIKSPGTLFTLEQITGLSVSPGRDQLVVIHTNKGNDLVVTLRTEEDRVGELVGALCARYQQ
ncbi:unnamed protein product [Nesidiocoris tenuis]|uniref:Myosin motor domain-containing protein n=1 Tax=Nesidiocoris tenuis TaxID=355587 RepID=A0A6H5GD53_9HEMI|nr:unnamed protein product [Nesidiocoris tenuis]